MASLIMSRRMLKHLTVLVEFVPDYVDESGYQLHGDCLWLDDNHSPREFHIRINSSLNRKRQLIALAHELVHVKQYATNELHDTIRGVPQVKWKKQTVNENKIHYFDLDWEIEARGREEGLYVRYVEHLRREQIKFDE